MEESNNPGNERNFHISQLANKSLRAFNFIIDTVIINVLNYFYISSISSSGNSVSDSYSFLTPSFVIIFLLYYVLFEYFTGKSLGKYITKTIVLTEGGLKPSFINIIGRSLCRLIPFEPLSCLIDAKAYGWHDSFSKTIVIPENIL